MSTMAISARLPGAATPAKSQAPDKVHAAAEQFEALLMGQILRSARQNNSGWDGSQDSSAECATDYAEQQFSAVLAKQGGLGLASMVVKGLDHKQ